MCLFGKKKDSFFMPDEDRQKPYLRIRSTVVPKSFDDKAIWDRDLYDNKEIIDDSQVPRMVLSPEDDK